MLIGKILDQPVDGRTQESEPREGHETVGFVETNY